MCGRFVQAHGAAEYAEHFGASVSVAESLRPSWNVAPTDSVYAVAEHDGRRMLGTFRWGLIPWFAKDAKMGARHINARAETAASKPAFRDSLARRRCIIPADGFYEWERLESGGKLPHFIFREDGSPLALAGLWASWRDDEGERIASCTVITTTPNDLVSPIHDRMPVVLTKNDWEAWLSPDLVDAGDAEAMMRPLPPGLLAEYPVSTLVNSVRNNFAECIEPLR